MFSLNGEIGRPEELTVAQGNACIITKIDGAAYRASSAVDISEAEIELFLFDEGV